MLRTIELYNLLKGKIGEEESKALVETINEMSDKVKQEAATKADLENVKIELKGEIKQVETRLEGEIKTLRLEIKIFFLILFFFMFLTNPRAVDLITKMLGFIK